MELYSDDAERAELYRLFSALFMKEPDEEILGQAKEIFGMDFKDSAEQIGNDFTAIFLRPDLHMAPYESLHNFPPGDKPGLAGKAARDVQAFYESAGLSLQEGMDLIPDHLSVELLFMSYLAENRYTEKLHVFLEEHLLRWVPEYCDEVGKHATTAFYKEIANLLKEFIISEYSSMK